MSDDYLIEDEDIETALYFKEKWGPFGANICTSRNPERCDICGARIKHSEKHVKAQSLKDKEKPPLRICFGKVCGKALFGEVNWNKILFKSIAGRVEHSSDPRILKEEIEADEAAEVKKDAMTVKFLEDCRIATSIARIHSSDKKDGGFNIKKIVSILLDWDTRRSLTSKQLDTLQKYNRACKRESFVETL